MFLYDSAVYRADIETALASVPNIELLRDCSVMISGATGLIGSFLVDMLF